MGSDLLLLLLLTMMMMLGIRELANKQWTTRWGKARPG